MLLVALCISLGSIALVVKKSHLDKHLLELILLPAGVITVGIICGLVGTIVLVVLLLTEAPELASISPLIISLSVMVVTSIISINAFRQGWAAKATT